MRGYHGIGSVVRRGLMQPLMIASCVGLGCTALAQEPSQPAGAQEAPPSSRCGNGICEDSETPFLCAADCEWACETPNDTGWVLFGQPLPFPVNQGKESDSCEVEALEALGEGHRPEVSVDGRLVVFDRRVAQSYELFVMRVDGSGQRCVTCDSRYVPEELKGRHKGAGAWHPGSSLILFVAENEHGRHGPTNTPAYGEDCDLWLLDFETLRFQRLTMLPKGRMVRRLCVSPAGGLVLWSERYRQARPQRRGCERGLWMLRQAELVLGPQPHLESVVDVAPLGKGFYEPGSFSPDGGTVLFSAACDPRGSQAWADLFAYDVSSGAVHRVTSSTAVDDTGAAYSPSGKLIAWAGGPYVGLMAGHYESEIYLTKPGGDLLRRLTWFNGNDVVTKGVGAEIETISWLPDGTAIVAAAASPPGGPARIYRVGFKGPCGAE